MSATTNQGARIDDTDRFGGGDSRSIFNCPKKRTSEVGDVQDASSREHSGEIAKGVYAHISKAPVAGQPLLRPKERGVAILAPSVSSVTVEAMDKNKISRYCSVRYVQCCEAKLASRLIGLRLRSERVSAHQAAAET